MNTLLPTTLTTTGRLRCGLIIGSRLDRPGTLICTRLQFQLEDGRLLEHIFNGRRVLLAGIDAPVYKQDLLGAGSLLSVKLTGGFFDTRTSADADWQSVEISLGSLVQLNLTDIHQRTNYYTGCPFVNDFGDEIWHAKYCHLVPCG